MIPLISYNEDVSDFPGRSVDMRPACTPTIRERLRQSFHAQHVTYLGRGYNNAHHRLTGVPGLPDLVVRRVLAPVDALAKRLEREYHVLEHLSHHDYPHAPRPIRQIDPHEIDGSPAFAMTFVNGTPPKLDVETAKELGLAVGLLHKLPVPTWLAEAGSTTEPLPILLAMSANWQRNLAGVYESLPEGHRKRLAALIEEVPRRLHTVDWTSTATVLLHGDLGIQNLRRDGTAIVFLDWEFASVSDPTLDFMWVFNNEGFGELQKAAFLKAYETTVGMEVPRVWHDRLCILQSICAVELALWAQSGVKDIKEGKNRGFFRPGDLRYLEHSVARVFDLEACTLRSGG